MLKEHVEGKVIELQDVKAFARKIVIAACIPIRRRRGLSKIEVGCSLRSEGSASGSQTYRFCASFDFEMRGADGSIRDRVIYESPTPYMHLDDYKESDTGDYLGERLVELQENVSRESQGRLVSTINGSSLVVDALTFSARNA